MRANVVDFPDDLSVPAVLLTLAAIIILATGAYTVEQQGRAVTERVATR